MSKYPAKVEVHRYCASGDIPFFICHVTTWLMCQVTLWVGSPHPKSPSLGSIGLMEVEIMAFVISFTIPIPIPMPRFQCRGLQIALVLYI